MTAYGWKPDSVDGRDHLFSVVHHPHIAELPSSVDLSGKMPAVFDQGELGSCTANAILAAFGFIHPGFTGSRLALYYDERNIEGTVNDDAGAEIRDGIKVMATQGVPSEAEWPYNIGRFREAPPQGHGNAFKLSSYSRLVTGDDFHQCLAAGFPFVLGFQVWPDLESDAVASTGRLPLPNYDVEPIGGHAVCVIGYDQHSPVGDAFLVRNSWGRDWGLKGDFWVPRAYFEHQDLASDAWTLRA